MTSPFLWRGQPSIHIKPSTGRRYTFRGLVTPYNPSPAITGRDQGQKDADRRDSIRRGLSTRQVAIQREGT